MIFLADASNNFTGQLIYGAAAVVGLIIAVGSYFATRGEVDDVKKRLDKQDADIALHAQQADENYRRLDRSDEARISGVHNRLNPIERDLSRMGGQMEAFTLSFEKFTRIIESTSRARDEQTAAFIRALETFATVLSEKDKR